MAIFTLPSSSFFDMHVETPAAFVGTVSGGTLLVFIATCITFSTAWAEYENARKTHESDHFRAFLKLTAATLFLSAAVTWVLCLSNTPSTQLLEVTAKTVSESSNSTALYMTADDSSRKIIWAADWYKGMLTRLSISPEDLLPQIGSFKALGRAHSLVIITGIVYATGSTGLIIYLFIKAIQKCRSWKTTNNKKADTSASSGHTYVHLATIFLLVSCPVQHVRFSD